MRLAVFLDQVFWREGGSFSTDGAYALFLASFADCGHELTFIGREAPVPGSAAYRLEHRKTSLLPLPYYPSLYQLWRANPRALHLIRNRIRAAAPSWDAVIVAAPHPIGHLIARQCLELNVPIVLNVRQNLKEMMMAHRGLKRIVAFSAAWLLDRDLKRLARNRPVIAVGRKLADEFRRVTNSVHEYFPCLVTRDQFDHLASLPSCREPTRLLWVGRLAPEKGLFVLLDALSLLRSRGLVCYLDLAGEGPLLVQLERRVDELGLSDYVRFQGYVPYGPSLFELYRHAGAFVLPSFTEGFPQVLNEALCAGLPTVATSVGGIPSFLRDGVTALLVSPGNVEQLAAAIQRLVSDGALRQQLRVNGRGLMAEHTLEMNRGRILTALADEVLSSRSRIRPSRGVQVPSNGAGW